MDMRRPVLVMVALATTAGAHVATADGTSLQGLQVTAETAAKTARETDDPDAYEVCGAAYVEVANRARTEFPAHVPDSLYNAATCFARGGSVGAAITLLDRLAAEHPTHRITAHATLQAAHLFATIGWFDQAATRFEAYAARYAAELEARDALENAFRLRLALGDDDRARADGERYLKLFGAKDPSRAADAAFVMALRVRERGKPDDAVRALRQWIKTYGGRDRERLVSAYLVVGELLWDASCPVKPVDGLCLARDRAAASVPRCKGPVPLVGVARDAARVKEAQAALEQAVRLSEVAGSSDTRAMVAGEQARLLLADARIERAIQDTLPAAELEPDGRMTPASARDQAAWLAQWQKGLAEANRSLEDLVRSKNLRVAVTAVGRTAWLAQYATDTLRSAPLPVGKRKGKGTKAAFAEEVGAVYCAALGDLSGPLEVRARDAATMCVEKAGELGVVDGAEQCVAIFDQIDPATIGADERLPLPAPPRVTDLEPPARYRPPMPTPTP